MDFSSFTSSHILQSDNWGKLKSLFGWEPERLQSAESSMLVLFKALPLGYSIAYVPKAKPGTNWPELRLTIENACRQRKAVFLQFEPDFYEPYNETDLDSLFPGYGKVNETIQPRGTILIDLHPDEETILGCMKQKTRYNIRLAERKGVKVELSDDLDDFYKQMVVTSKRDGFAVHAFSYYKRAYEIFAPQGECSLLRASYNGESLAYLMLFLSGTEAWYFYGASNDKHRNLMPTYLLQWEAMRYAKAHGALVYDLWGIPDANEEELEAQFTQQSEGLWGVYRFKRGFGGRVTRSAPAYVKVFKPFLYKAYVWLKKRRTGGEHASL